MLPGATFTLGEQTALCTTSGKASNVDSLYHDGSPDRRQLPNLRPPITSWAAEVRAILAGPRIAQFIIATHSPMLLCLPGARVLELEDGQVTEVSYRDTEHYRLSRDFLNDPDRYLRHLLADDQS